MSTKCATEKRFDPRSSGKHRAHRALGDQKWSRGVCSSDTKPLTTGMVDGLCFTPWRCLLTDGGWKAATRQLSRCACVWEATRWAMLPSESDSSISCGLWMFNKPCQLCASSRNYRAILSALPEWLLNFIWPNSVNLTFLALCRRSNSFLTNTEVLCSRTPSFFPHTLPFSPKQLLGPATDAEWSPF